MLDLQDVRQVIGRELRGADGEKIGTIGTVFADQETGAPEWAAVNTGLFGLRETFVPLAESTFTGEAVTVPYTKEQVKDAPDVDSSGEYVSESDERALYGHYGLPYTSTGSTYADSSAADGGLGGAAQGGTSTPLYEEVRQEQTSYEGGTDDAMTRSEQRVDVGTERVTTGKARLRKWVETENVQVEVPVTREKARLETEPITDANRDEALSGAELTEAEHEVTLTEERPVVNKETVPVERVRLTTETEQDTETVQETVGKERIDLDGDAETTLRPSHQDH